MLICNDKECIDRVDPDSEFMKDEKSNCGAWGKHAKEECPDYKNGQVDTLVRQAMLTSLLLYHIGEMTKFHNALADNPKDKFYTIHHKIHTDFVIFLENELKPV